MTQEALADASGMHLTYVSGIELRERNPTWQKFASLASSLEMTVDELAKAAREEGERRRAADAEQPPSSEAPSR